MDNEIKNEKCSYKDLELKYKQCLNDNEHLAKMMRNLRQENDKLNNESRNQTSRFADESLRLAEGKDKRKQKYNILLEINHGWKKDYEKLEMRFRMRKKREIYLMKS